MPVGHHRLGAQKFEDLRQGIAIVRGEAHAKQIGKNGTVRWMAGVDEAIDEGIVVLLRGA